jgi:hypothetical protein
VRQVYPRTVVSVIDLVLVLCMAGSSIVKYSLWFHPIWARANDLRYSRWAHLPLHHLLGRDDNSLTFCKVTIPVHFLFIEIYKCFFFVQETWHLPNMANTIGNDQPGICFIIEQLSIDMTSFIEHNQYYIGGLFN